MLPVFLVLCTIATWVDFKDRIGIRLPVYCMRCLCFITQASFLPAFFKLRGTNKHYATFSYCGLRLTLCYYLPLVELLRRDINFLFLINLKWLFYRSQCYQIFYFGDIKILFIYFNILMILNKILFGDFHSMLLQNLP